MLNCTRYPWTARYSFVCLPGLSVRAFYHITAANVKFTEIVVTSCFQLPYFLTPSCICGYRVHSFCLKYQLSRVWNTGQGVFLLCQNWEGWWGKREQRDDRKTVQRTLASRLSVLRSWLYFLSRTPLSNETVSESADAPSDAGKNAVLCFHLTPQSGSIFCLFLRMHACGNRAMSKQLMPQPKLVQWLRVRSLNTLWGSLRVFRHKQPKNERR